MVLYQGRRGVRNGPGGTCIAMTLNVGERAVRARVRAELLPRDVRVARRKPIRRVTCLKTRSSPNPVFLNTTISRERPQTLATRPARQAPIRCPGARTRLRALYLSPSFPIIRRTNPRHRALFSPKKLGKARTQASRQLHQQPTQDK